MYRFLWIFFIYAFLGWCTEVSYAALVSGRFINRGFLNGPVCPIYGLGVVLVMACLEPFRDNLLLLFVCSVLLTSLLEWITGFVLEKLFHQRWWDYSNEPFNLGGYVCLRFSIAWGLACVFVSEILHPTVLLLIRLIPRPVGWVLLGVFGTAMAVDLVATVRTIAKLNRQLDQIDEMAQRIREASNEFGENLADRVLDAAEKGAELREQRRAAARAQVEQHRAAVRQELEERKERLQRLLEGNNLGQRRLLAAFPQMRSTRHRQALERLRRHSELLRERRRK